MIQWQDVLTQLLEPERFWLRTQPGMLDWDSGCRRLGEALMKWVTEYTCALCEQPDCFDEPPTSADVQERGQRRLEKVWQVWQHHWRDAIQIAKNAPVDGFEVANLLQEGCGVRASQHPSSSADVAAAPAARLGGNPLSDILLADAMLSHDNRAVATFAERFQPLAADLYWQKRRAPPNEAWWNSFLAEFVTGDRLRNYRGEAGLDAFVAVSLQRALIRKKHDERDVSDRLNYFPPKDRWDSLLERLTPARQTEVTHKIERLAQQREVECSFEFRAKVARRFLNDDEIRQWNQNLAEMSAARKRHLARPSASTTDTDSEECRGLLQRLLVDGVQQALSPGQTLALHYSLVRGELGKSIAHLLEIHPGNVSRHLAAASKRLNEFLAKRLAETDSFAADCRDCLALLGGHGLEHLAELLNHALETTTSTPEMPSFATTLGGRPS